MENPDKLKGNTSKLAKEPGKGYPLEVDVSYPYDLHDLHNNLLFMCEKRKISGVQKQVPNLYDEKKYVIHIRCSNTGLSWMRSVEQLSSTKVHGWHHTSCSTPNFEPGLRTILKRTSSSS